MEIVMNLFVEWYAVVHLEILEQIDTVVFDLL